MLIFQFLLVVSEVEVFQGFPPGQGSAASSSQPLGFDGMKLRYSRGFRTFSRLEKKCGRWVRTRGRN